MVGHAGVWVEAIFVGAADALPIVWGRAGLLGLGVGGVTTRFLAGGGGRADAVVGAAGELGYLSVSVRIVVQWAAGGHHGVPLLSVVVVGGGDGLS